MPSQPVSLAADTLPSPQGNLLHQPHVKPQSALIQFNPSFHLSLFPLLRATHALQKHNSLCSPSTLNSGDCNEERRWHWAERWHQDCHQQLLCGSTKTWNRFGSLWSLTISCISISLFSPLVSSVAEPWFGNYRPVVSAVGNQRKRRGDKYLSAGTGRNIIIRLQGWKTEPWFLSSL